MNITTSELAGITGGRLTGPADLTVKGLITDSRQFSHSEGLCFFAIKGPNHDGHRFINQLYGRGIRIFVAERLPEEAEDTRDASFVVVENSIEALQKLASHKRKQFKGKVIAITGSAGKTVVKEWLADIMGMSGPVVRSPKSYNSQIGVPLSVWRLDDNFGKGIFEAGISLPGEMLKLEKIISPDMGVITNIGDAHSENFPDIVAKASEKLNLFINCPIVVYCSDQRIIRDLIVSDRRFASKKIIDWSEENEKASAFVKKTVRNDGKTVASVRYSGNTTDLIIPFADRASVENALTVAIVCLAAGMEPETVRRGIGGLVSVAMRMEIKSGINGCQLIEDYYNSDPGSLSMALEYLKSQNNRRSTLILSDFLQSGRDEKELYGEVADLVIRMGIERFIGIGEILSRNRMLFSPGSRFYHSTGEFIHNFDPADFSDEIILLKGARVFEFEKISQHLEQQVHQTVLEINLDAILHNLNEFRKRLNPGTRIMAMVKAFAYGAGPSEIAALLEYHRVDYMAVAYADEGAELREAGVSAPIVVMNPELSAFGMIIKYNLEPEIYSLRLMRDFAAAVSRHGADSYPVHIKIDSGMHRLGFMPDETDKLIEQLRTAGSLHVVSVFTHLAASEDPSLDDFTRKQVKEYLAVAEKIKSAIGYSFLMHVLNSSGVARFPEYQLDMVRPGIGLYGVNGMNGMDLRPAGRYRTRISQVKRIPAGDPVGYGCADVSESVRTIAVLPVGYADGLDRKLGNGNGALFIKGHKVPVVGNICMDMCMADVTSLNVAEGDEAEIFGTNIKVEEMAARCGTIPYEILTSIPARVRRVFYRE